MDGDNSRDTAANRSSLANSTHSPSPLSVRTPSPFPPPSNSSVERDPQLRLTNAEKWSNFKSYLLYENIQSTRNQKSEDPDLFYEDIDDSLKLLDVIYYEEHNERSSSVRSSSGDINSVDNYIITAYDRLDVHRPQMKKQLDEDEEFQKGLQYDDSLSIKYLENPFETNLPLAQYKNNILECHGRYLFFAAWSRVAIFKDETFIKWIETRPAMTLREHVEASINPESPHSINFLKVVNFRDQDVLALCCDDGRGVLYDIEHPDEGLEKIMEFNMSCSVWGVDALNNYIAFSDNSHRVTLFYYEEDCMYVAVSHELLHNITDLKIAGASTDKIWVGCSSISGELVTFEFTRIRNISASDKPIVEKVPTIQSNSEHVQVKYSFGVRVINRLSLSDQCWSIHHVNEKDFKQVHSPDCLGSQYEINVVDILNKSKRLGLLENQLLTSDLGGAAKYEWIFIETMFNTYVFERDDFASITDKMTRVKKDYFQELEHIPELKNSFYIITNQWSVGLIRTNGLIPIANTGVVYDWCTDENTEFSNRLSITKVIPELSAYIAITQVGVMTIFRMVKHRGLYSLREEYVYPLRPHEGLKLIVGCATRKVYDGVYWVYLLFMNGSSVKFELSNDEDGCGINAALI